MSPLKISVIGASGRLGSEILSLIRSNSDVELVDAVVSPNSKFISESVPGFEVKFTTDCRSKADVLIDASLPSRLERSVSEAEKLGAALLVLSTGHNSGAIENISTSIPFCYASNTSLGIHLLLDALRHLAPKSKESFSFHIVETHHSLKKDAPSGTAKSLANAIESSGAEVQVQSIRGGTVPGEHEIKLLGAYEEITITHKAQSRALFATGALKLARKLSRMKPGKYSSSELFFDL